MLAKIAGAKNIIVSFARRIGAALERFPEDGLTDFLHVFGSTGATAKATFPWASNYVPG